MNIWEEVMFAGLERVGLYYGTYPAIVLNNQDPDSKYRLEVSIPDIYQHQKAPGWIIGKYVFGGEDYGLHVLPSIGDMVYITFRRGSLKYPMWQHGGYSAGELPAEYDKPWKYGFKTPKGKLVIIDDGDPSDDNDLGSVKITHQNGEYFEIHEDLIKMDGKEINIGVDNLEWTLKGETTQDELNKSKARIDLIINAINNGITAANDGGAAYKASMIGILSAAVDEDYTNIKSTKVKAE